MLINKTLLGLKCFQNPMMLIQMREFAKASHYVGANDYIRQEKHQMRKYGMKRHFYDNIPLIQRQVPKDQYREGLSGEELAPYSEEVK